ncbi:putative phosphatidylcholine--sterol O-acyltransferase [Lupinus albus]|uniref:Putative phosphatidylcholine--sterol O-acyltransferase n=1 Tax=Lupinus albus TaxID=3870 RepID=A0A6A4Q746_LUPAL|nr:putative phosphatidylcholine--sterol O-acyltransferase [Lupinus albus]
MIKDQQHGLKICTMMIVMLYLACTFGASSSSSSNLHPLIIIPGIGGNQLEAKLTNEYKPCNFFCEKWYPLVKKKDGWFRLWFDITVLFGPFTQCFADRMKLHYDIHRDDYYNTPGVHIRVPQFGSTSSLLYLNPLLK